MICCKYFEDPYKNPKTNLVGVRCTDPYLKGKRIIDCKYFVDDEIQCPIKEDVLKMETCCFCGYILQDWIVSEGKRYCPNPKCRNELKEGDTISYKEFIDKKE